MSTRIGVDEYGDVMLFCDDCRWEHVWRDGAIPSLTSANVLDVAHLTACRPARRRRVRDIIEGPAI